MTSFGWRRTAIIVFLALLPLRTNFLLGQEHVLVLLLLTAAAWFYFKGRNMSSALSLAVAAALKIYPALFLLYFVRKRDWRSAATLLAGLLALGLLCLTLFGSGMCRVYLLQVLPRTLRGEAVDPYAGSNSSTALLHRLFIAEPELNPHPPVHLPVAYAFLQPAVQLILLLLPLWLIRSRRSDAAREKLEWGSFIAVLLILSSQPASYHYCALILAAIMISDYLVNSRSLAQAGLVLGLYTLVCCPLDRLAPNSPSGWLDLLAFPRLAVLTALWIVLLRLLRRAKAQAPRGPTRIREAVLFCAVFVLGLAGAAWSNFRHLRRALPSYSSRLLVTPESLMASEPAAAAGVGYPLNVGGTVLFTTLSLAPAEYVLHEWRPFSAVSYDFGTDAFHPSLAPGPSSASGLSAVSRLTEGWVELAARQSRIVRFPLNDPLNAAGRLQVEAEDAEQPTISPDGKWLAFIRETSGRGSLWLKRVGVPSKGEEPAETQLIDQTYDVRDAGFFPDGRIVFAAQPGNVSNLFAVEPWSRRVSSVIAGRRAERYPAVSPDGRWVAYAKLDGSVWQLYVLNLGERRERRLTDADCNSTMPAWLSDSKTLIYSTDCSRGLGLGALVRIRAAP